MNTPAYEDTSVGTRSLDAAFASLARKFEADVAEVRQLAQENDLTKFFKRSDKAETKNSAHAALAKALTLN